MIKLVKGIIRIISVPDGEAPLAVRKKWLGLELPVNAIHAEGSHGVLTGKKSPQKIVYCVDQVLALEILSRAHSDAAMWWNEHGYPHIGNVFCFNKGEVEEVGKIEELVVVVKMYVGILEEGVGAHDSWANVGGGRN